MQHVRHIVLCSQVAEVSAPPSIKDVTVKKTDKKKEEEYGLLNETDFFQNQTVAQKMADRSARGIYMYMGFFDLGCIAWVHLGHWSQIKLNRN